MHYESSASLQYIALAGGARSVVYSPTKTAETAWDEIEKWSTISPDIDDPRAVYIDFYNRGRAIMAGESSISEIPSPFVYALIAIDVFQFDFNLRRVMPNEGYLHERFQRLCMAYKLPYPETRLVYMISTYRNAVLDQYKLSCPAASIEDRATALNNLP